MSSGRKAGGTCGGRADGSGRFGVAKAGEVGVVADRAVRDHLPEVARSSFFIPSPRALPTRTYVSALANS